MIMADKVLWTFTCRYLLNRAHFILLKDFYNKNNNKIHPSNQLKLFYNIYPLE